MIDGPQDGEGNNLWERLRRRKVVQWGLAYAAGAWGLLQGLEYVTSTFEWPRQFQQLATVALLIGLPIALTIAWFHGDRGHRRVTRTELAILTLLLLLGGGLFWRYQPTGRSSAATGVATTTVSNTPADTRPSIAVLPFDNRSNLEEDVFFVDGIHDDILTQLSKVSALKVISRTSVEQFRDTKLPIKSIAERLGVSQILEGGVQRVGDRVRVTAQLIDANTDAHLWAENYDRELTAVNIFAIQSEVAAAIAGALKATLTADEKTRLNAIPTQNLEAWEAYQLGKQRMARRTSEALAEAERFFRRAIELDPKFALAYVGLSDTLRLQIEYSGAPLEATLEQADGAADEALKLDSNLAEAWTSRGGIAMSRADNTTAERLLRRAVELNPNYATAQVWLGHVLNSRGQFQEAHEHVVRAARLDPLSAVAQINVGASLENMGRPDEAATHYRRAIEADPISSAAYASLAILEAYARNRFEAAVSIMARAVELDVGSPYLAAQFALLYLDIDDAPEAQRRISATAQRWPDDYSANAYAAAILSTLGEDARGERHAQRAFEAYPLDNFAIGFLRNTDLQKGNVKDARARYESAYPELLSSSAPQVNAGNCKAAVDLVAVLQRSGEIKQATALLDSSELAIRQMPRLGFSGYGIADVAILALRGDKAKALKALREAEKAGWRGPAWRYFRDIDPNLDSIRDDPEFKAIFADIERDMARQRAALAGRPKDAPLDLGPVH